MPTLDEIQQAIAFIEAHLCEEVGVGDIADAVGYSLYHFSRTFNATVQHTPYDYLMRRRLSESARDLLATDSLIIDIAYDYAFANPETYTRAFKRMFGVLPSAVRGEGRLPYRTAMPRLTAAHLVHRTGCHAPRPRLIALPRLPLAGLMTLLPHGDAPGDATLALWQLLGRDLNGESRGTVQGVEDEREQTAPLQDHAWAVLRYPEGQEDGCRLYTAAVQAAGAPPLVPRLIVPPGRYVRCELHDGLPETLALTRDYVAHTWLPRAGHGALAPLELLTYSELPGTDDVVPAAFYLSLA